VDLPTFGLPMMATKPERKHSELIQSYSPLFTFLGERLKTKGEFVIRHLPLSSFKRIKVRPVIIVIFVFRLFEQADDAIGDRRHQRLDAALEQIVGDDQRLARWTEQSPARETTWQVK